MSFLWGSSAAQQEFDSLVEKCTSDLLPSQTPLDLPEALHLADLIRSSAVPPSHAVKTLLVRLQHNNPNVQLLALALFDVALKNGGSGFLSVLAKPAAQGGAATDFELLAAGRKAGGVNRDVEKESRKLLQEWASAFKGSGKKELEASEVVEAYERLKRDGVEFPQLDRSASKAMVESLSAPDWLDSPYCTRCRTPFSTFNRKHHCRNCGQVFDAACSSSVSPLPHYGILEPVRVCDACYRKIKEGKGASVAKEVEAERRKQQKEVEGSTKAEIAKNAGASSTRREQQEDEDLRRAIEASLKDAQPEQVRTGNNPPVEPQRGPGYNPSYASTIASQADSKAGGGGGGKKDVEEDDPDLAAAIAASLRDLAPPASAPHLARSSSSSTAGGGEALTYSQLFPRSASNAPYAASTYSTSSYSQPPPPPVSKRTFTLPNHDLPPHDLSLLHRFSSAGIQPGPYFAQQGRGDYEVLRGGLEERLERSREDTVRRVQVLREMEWKLSEAARVYGAGLVETARAYQPSLSRAQSYAQQQPAQPVPPTPVSHQHQPLDARYLPSASSYAPLSAGQPLPAYAVPPAQQQAQGLPSQPLAPHPEPQTEYQPQPQPLHVASPPPFQQQQPAGYYKPSSFPAVPTTNLPLPLTGLETLPAAPSGRPWEEEERVQEGQGQKVREAELIEL
ncbi:hypothetical protein JCM8547_008451 [Rhodosporidiobolus lusitaniae]